MIEAKDINCVTLYCSTDICKSYVLPAIFSFSVIYNCRMFNLFVFRNHAAASFIDSY